MLLEPNVDSFHKFYTGNRNRLFAYLLRLTVDGDRAIDILQETFTKYLERYGREKLSVPLLYTIARNAFLDDNRRRSREELLLPAEDNPGPNPEGSLLVRENYRRVMGALRQLKPEAREVLSLVVSSGLPYRSVASILGISESCVKVTVHRARLQLKKILLAGES